MKHTISFTFLLLICLFSQSLNAQSYEREFFARRKNVLSGEILGAGGMTSINYSRVIGSWRHLFVDGKVGLGTDGIPHGFNLNIGGGDHYFQVGLMGKLSYWDIDYADATPEPQYNVFPVFGYKFHPTDKHFFMNVYYMTYKYSTNYPNYVGSGSGTEQQHWIGIGVGYAFK